jgi:hypothetical protein
MSKGLQAIYEYVGDLSRKAAESWFKQQCANPYASLYLYYRDGELVVSEDLPSSDYELATGGRLKPGATIDQQCARINAIAQCLPILPKELCI